MMLGFLLSKAPLYTLEWTCYLFNIYARRVYNEAFPNLVLLVKISYPITGKEMCLLAIKI